MQSNSSTTSPNHFPSKPHTPTSPTWPYKPADFHRADSSSDTLFYRSPRFVTHIDDAAISRLTAYYDTVLPSNGKMLDLCASWNSFYPTRVEDGVHAGSTRVWGIGLNGEEMAANPLFKSPDNSEARWVVGDLNADPQGVLRWFGEDGDFDAVTCCVSIDYLVHPLEVCKMLRRGVKEGGSVQVVVSNRCFPSKVVRRWREVDELGRLQLVGDYLHFSGWKEVQVVDLCMRDEQRRRVTDDMGAVLDSHAAGWASSHFDPLWVVRGVKLT